MCSQEDNNDIYHTMYKMLKFNAYTFHMIDYWIVTGHHIVLYDVAVHAFVCVGAFNL